jgi:hypothetical protein
VDWRLTAFGSPRSHRRGEDPHRLTHTRSRPPSPPSAPSVHPPQGWGWGSPGRPADAVPCRTRWPPLSFPRPVRAGRGAGGASGGGAETRFRLPTFYRPGAGRMGDGERGGGEGGPGKVGTSFYVRRPRTHEPDGRQRHVSRISPGARSTGRPIAGYSSESALPRDPDPRRRDITRAPEGAAQHFPHHAGHHRG